MPVDSHNVMDSHGNWHSTLSRTFSNVMDLVEPTLSRDLSFSDVMPVDSHNVMDSHGNWHSTLSKAFFDVMDLVEPTLSRDLSDVMECTVI